VLDRMCKILPENMKLVSGVAGGSWSTLCG
jgi:hypothetical protein